MPQFSRSSRINLLGCHHDLQRIFVAVGRRYRIEVLRGFDSIGQTTEDRLTGEEGRSVTSLTVRVLNMLSEDDHCHQFVSELTDLSEALYARGITTHRLSILSCSDEASGIRLQCRLD